jgi:glycosyltransferase involved in cell wall biosynthesis
MTILLVVPWDQEYGGVASVVGNLARYLSRRGHRVLFLHPGDGNRIRPRTTAWGFSGYDINLRTPFIAARPLRSILGFLAHLPSTLYQLWRLLRSEGIQVVNVHYPGDQFFLFAVLRWLRSMKLVVSVHGADVLPDGRPRARYGWLFRAFLASADAVVAPSQAFLEDVIRLFPRTKPRALFVHNGIDLQELAGVDSTTPAIRGHYLLCIAAHNSKKALDVLLRAFTSISAGVRSLRLVLVGDGPLRREHEQLARALSLQERVDFLGSRSRSEVVRLLRECELFVLPSRSEPFGIVVAEALACRKAVVASAVGGIPEIIEDGRSGVLVKPDDPDALARAVLELLADEGRRESLGRAGYERITALFSYDAMGASYENLYSRLARGQPQVLARR